MVDVLTCDFIEKFVFLIGYPPFFDYLQLLSRRSFSAQLKFETAA